MREEHDGGAGELVIQALANAGGLDAPFSQARRFTGAHHTFLVGRFDRTPVGRLHFASATTSTGQMDGASRCAHPAIDFEAPVLGNGNAAPDLQAGSHRLLLALRLEMPGRGLKVSAAEASLY